MSAGRRQERTGLPHGRVPVAGIADKAVREALMKLSENIAALERRVAAAERKAGK